MIDRFTNSNFVNQFKYCKLLLVTFFRLWVKVDSNGFNEYAK